MKWEMQGDRKWDYLDSVMWCDIRGIEPRNSDSDHRACTSARLSTARRMPGHPWAPLSCVDTTRDNNFIMNISRPRFSPHFPKSGKKQFSPTPQVFGVVVIHAFVVFSAVTLHYFLLHESQVPYACGMTHSSCKNRRESGLPSTLKLNTSTDI